MRCVTLGGGKTVSLRTYTRAWKACLGLAPGAQIGPGVSGWGETAGEALDQLRAGLADRINRNIPGFGVGRKWSPNWQREMVQSAAMLNTPRLIIRWLPADLLRVPKFRERVEYGRAT